MNYRKSQISSAAVRLMVMITILCALQACGPIKAPSAQRRDNALTLSLETYRKLMRWGYYEEATQYLKTQDGKTELPDLKALAHYKITNFHVGDKLVTDAGTEARVIAYIEYYNIDSGVVGSFKDEQYWWYDEPNTHWYLGSPFPDLGGNKAAR